jgi:uncharacterized protein YggL (DUF469 family)
MTKKSIQAALESTFLHGGAFSADLLNSVLMNFIDELEECLGLILLGSALVRWPGYGVCQNAFRL